MIIVIVVSVLLFFAVMYFGEIVIHQNTINGATSELGFMTAFQFMVAEPLKFFAGFGLIVLGMVALVALEAHRQKMENKFFENEQNERL